MTDPHPTECHVCGETVEDPKLLSECLNCGRPFHLNPYSDEEHKDCGDALIGPSMGIEFWCNPCLAELEAAEQAAGVNPAGQMMELIAGPGQQPPLPARPAPAPPTAAPAPGTPPPRRQRSTERRRFRRIDRE